MRLSSKMLRRSSESGKSGQAARKGQITVFLSLAFLLLMSTCFVTIEGVREYMTGALAEDALEGAAQDILANYDKPLFHRYHIFFLDPREKGQIRRDAVDYLNHYYDESAFFGWTCRSFKVTFLDGAADREGKLFKHQIREWIKYRKIFYKGKGWQEGSWDDPDEKQKILDMSEAYKSLEKMVSAYREELQSTPLNVHSDEGDSAGKADKDGQNQERAGLLSIEEEEEISEEAILWKSIRESLEIYENSDPLYCCLGSEKALSGLETDLIDLPSHGKGGSGEGSANHIPACSFRDPGEMVSLFPASEKNQVCRKYFYEEDYIISYIRQLFGHYPDKAGKTNSGSSGWKGNHSGNLPASNQKALAYEIEYMLEGKKSDVENLRRVADRIFSQRFLLNYDYARKNPDLWSRAGQIADLAAGQEEMPDNPEAGRLLLTGAAAYGQTILDLKALLSGKRVAIVPEQSCWQASYENLPKLLRKGKPADLGYGKISYSDYLNYYLTREGMEKILCWRMMDVMQLNVRLSEERFRMKDCLFSFRWEADLQSAKWFPSVPGLNLVSGSFMRIKLRKTNSY